MFENLVKFRINCWAITLSDAEIHKDMYTWWQLLFYGINRG
jgi:hypothetical protein